MPRQCSICTHEKRPEIDSLLVQGSESFRTIAGRFGLTASAVQRHAQSHIPQALTRAAEAEEATRADDLLSRVKLLEDEAWELLKTAKQRAQEPKASPASLQAASSLVGKVADVLTLFGRISGELIEKHEHRHAHLHTAAPEGLDAASPAMVMAAGAELASHAHTLSEDQRRELVATLLAVPQDAAFLDLTEDAPQDAEVLEVLP